MLNLREALGNEAIFQRNVISPQVLRMKAGGVSASTLFFHGKQAKRFRIMFRAEVKWTPCQGQERPIFRLNFA
jgi:hypothetical protein